MRIVRFASHWPAVAALIAAAMLGIAHGFETFGHYPPCELCLKQRDVYWVILWSGVALSVASRLRPTVLRPACFILAVLFAAECAVAVYHAGVEWKWWPGPTSCTSAGTHAVSVADMANLLSGKPQHVVQCDVAAWRLIGLSMAGWNAVAAAGFTLASALFAWRGVSDHA
jgi:disulfide bond formation protein DsbB